MTEKTEATTMNIFGPFEISEFPRWARERVLAAGPRTWVRITVCIFIRYSDPTMVEMGCPLPSRGLKPYVLQ